MVNPKLVAIEPKSFADYELAVTESGAELSNLNSNVGALVWTDYSHPELLAKAIDENPQLTWVQLPFAGVDAFRDLLSAPVRFTSAKGAYREPVAEHALTLCLSLARAIPRRVSEKTWGKKFAVSMYDAEVVIVGAGGITEELLKLLAPFRCSVTVVRNQRAPMAGAHETINFEQLNDVLPIADFVILACALTEKTLNLFDSERFKAMKSTAYFVNIARGQVVDTDSLYGALESGQIAGAGIDVTYPEPLPDGHKLWSAPNLIITPHSADTPEMVTKLFAVRLRENVSAYLGSGGWVGEVSPELGY